MISLRRVAVHNLKDIDLDLPKGKLIVFCGRSGSGKSSLAMDTLYAEGQRRYIETFSPATRQFLERIDKPKAERLDGIPPAIAVTSQSRKMDSMTVGEATELFDYLAMLFANVGKVFCSQCSRQITVDTPQSVFQSLIATVKTRTKLQIAFAPPLENTAEEFTNVWQEQGFLRGWYNQMPFRLDEPIPPKCYHDGLLLIADRLVFDSAEEERLIESLESAFNYGDGKCCVLLESEILRFSRTMSCEYCQVHVPPLTPKLFRTDWINHVHLFADITSPTINDLNQRTIAELIDYFADSREPATMSPIISRLNFLHQTGLDYLTLSRPMNTLSGGEQRRIALTSALSSSLVDMLYVLDEPSLGLHSKDVIELRKAILELRNRGNTVILVEHDKQLLQSADHIVEIGPGAGDDGGTIVFQGTVEELRSDPKSLTGKYIHEECKNESPLPKGGGKGRGIALTRLAPTLTLPPWGEGTSYNPPSEKEGTFDSGTLILSNCTGNNLKNITVTFPLHTLCVITGVSGSGKSSLIRQTLYPALCTHFDQKNVGTGLPFGQLHVPSGINEAVTIDQLPMGRTSSSNPATYLKIFDDIRNFFAATVEAKAKHITARHFSFNVPGGRCEHCKGDGSLAIDMQFLPDQIVLCPECKGKRYQQSVLDVLYRGKSIADVLEMTAREAFSFFRGQAKLQHKLRLLFEVGLDYIRLGQPSGSLSGGEAQRLRLAGYLGQIRSSRSLILMDEPTAGLHFADVEQMLTCFQSLLTSGHSLIVIEHNEMVIEAADYRIELGPGAGDLGGNIIFEGN